MNPTGPSSPAYGRSWDRLGDGVFGIESGRIVAAMPTHGAYAEFVCLPPRELPVAVRPGLDPAEAVTLVLKLHHDVPDVASLR